MERAVPLRLDRWIPIRDVRQLVWRYLTRADREMVRCADNAQRRPHFEKGKGAYYERVMGFMEETAVRGHLELMQWAHGQRESVIPFRVGQAAVRGGHVRVVRWVRDNGGIWDVEMCYWAAQYGQLEVLQWLRQNGCSWDGSTWIMALRIGNKELIEWCRANGCPGSQ